MFIFGAKNFHLDTNRTKNRRQKKESICGDDFRSVSWVFYRAHIKHASAHIDAYRGAWRLAMLCCMAS